MSWSPNFQCSMVTDAWHLGNQFWSKTGKRPRVETTQKGNNPKLLCCWALPYIFVQCGKMWLFEKTNHRVVTNFARNQQLLESEFLILQGYISRRGHGAMGPLGWVPNGRPNFWASTRRSEESWPWRETCETCNGCFHRPCNAHPCAIHCAVQGLILHVTLAHQLHKCLATQPIDPWRQQNLLHFHRESQCELGMLDSIQALLRKDETAGWSL